ncbi:helix-turn-helix domain-containing protein [Paenibacillus hemerocallicola]|uniref:Helix-turn-helix domain-containing protein n=1 Tax=Paenibacillus hemerocallicola TaxID=1172614 RepID=A0A5C4TGE2_9BACL|nr:AraC family transcriptional regulator [Paenibacillus hemerocallicola]TNJ67706.1 helix-turn-helix domain-containing protein [Paenibacillus hemerocallicola]
MSNPIIPSMFRRSLLFHLETVRMHRVPPGKAESPEPRDAYTLFVVLEGETELTEGGRLLHMLPGAAFLSGPQNHIALRNIAAGSFDYCVMTFAAIEVRERIPHTYAEEPKAGAGYLLASPLNRVLRLIEQIVKDSPSPGEIDEYRRQACFQEMMALLIEFNYKSENRSAAKLVDDSLAYMHAHYMEDISVRQLAKLADVPQHQYTSVFQQATGKKPLDYLNGLRIERSKERLRASDAPLREIARQVGYRDEYYFSRRFRQLTGRTPRQYTLTPPERVKVRDWLGRTVEVPESPRRIVYHGETVGDLLALGAEVVGGSAFWSQRSVLGNLLRDVVDVGFMIDEDKLRGLKPDLIILASSDENKYGKAAAIAPTVTFDSFAPLRDRMSVLGNLLGLRHSAEQWLNTYEERSARMWHRLRDELAPGESASVFIADRCGKFFVMGAIGLPKTLYHDSGFRAPSYIGQLISQGRFYKEIVPRDLPALAGDRIFMVLTSEESSRKAAYALANSKLWQDLPAVRAGRVYWVEDESWNYGDALTCDRLVEQLPALLLQSS